MNKPFVSFHQPSKSIPNALKYGIMNEKVWYYYNYLHTLLDKEGLIDSDSACVYPGIGVDLHTIPAVFGKRKIIGFDAAGLKGFGIRMPIQRYNIKELNGLKEELGKYDIATAIEKLTRKCLTPGPEDRSIFGGNLTRNMIKGDNNKLLLIELLGLGIELDEIFLEEIEEHGLKCLHIFFKGQIYPDICIYQANVLDGKYEDQINNVMSQHKPKYYLEKSGQHVSKFESIPLTYMLERRETKVLGIGKSGEITVKEVKHYDYENEWTSIDQGQGAWEILRNYFSQIVDETLRYPMTEGVTDNKYRRDIDLLYRK